MSTPIGVIKKFVQALIDTKNTGEAAADEAFKAVGAVSYDTFKEKFHSAQSGLSTQDFLEQYCGIRVNNKDTGAITGSDAGGKATKTDESIIPEAAKPVSFTKAEYNSFTTNGLKVQITYLEKDDTAAGEKYGYSSATYLAKQKLVVRALYNWWIPEALDLINESLGLNFTDGRANVNEINVVFDDDFGNNECATALEFNYDMGRASEVTLYINANILYNMTANDKDGTLDNDKAIWTDFYGWHYMNGGAVGNLTPQFSNYLDRIILQSLAEVTIKSNVSYAYYLPKEITAGLCEIVGEFDSSNAYGQGNGLYSYAEDNWTTPHYGYGLMRYLAKNYSDGTVDGVSYNDKKTVLTVTDDFTDGAIDLANFESSVKTVKASSLKSGIKILGNDKANSILGGAGDDSLNGGKGNDTLNGGKGDDTLVGGAGKDVFIFTAGSDLIKDYSAGDKISIGGMISDVTLDGTNVVFTVGKNILTVKDAADMTLTIINSKGKELETLISGANSLTLDDKSKATVTIDSDIEFVDASSRTKNIKIAGNALDNTISGGSKNDSIKGGGGNDSLVGNAGKDTLNGGTGNDILLGGAGNDSLNGGDGADIFVYALGDGNDTIQSYAAEDRISLTSGTAEVTTEGNDIIFTIGTGKKQGTITILNGNGKTVTYYEDGIECVYPKSTGGVEFNEKGTAVTLTAEYEEDSFNINDYDYYKNKIVTIKASAVQHSLELVGNKNANKIFGTNEDDYIDGKAGSDTISGGSGNDSLWGGAGSDTLFGGDGKDTFIYYDGEGSDVIEDFDASLDKIRVLSGDVGTPTVDSSGDVTFAVGDGEIIVKGGANKYIPVYDKGKNILMKYNPR